MVLQRWFWGYSKSHLSRFRNKRSRW